MIFKFLYVYIGIDYVVFEFKEYFVGKLIEVGYQVVDYGVVSYDFQDDYFDYCILCVQVVMVDLGLFGIVLGGFGNGEQIVVNKVKGICVVLVYIVEIVELVCFYNNVNVVFLGGWMQIQEEVWQIVEIFLMIDFFYEDCYQCCIDKFICWEDKGLLG